jgi:hypothetical protein
VPNAAYEPDTFKYTKPASVHKYTPDFRIRKGVYIEYKGRLTKYDREKLILFKEQHPKTKLYIFFQNANKPIYKGSKTKYSDWANNNGFEWSETKQGIPEKWLK